MDRCILQLRKQSPDHYGFCSGKLIGYDGGGSNGGPLFPNPAKHAWQQSCSLDSLLHIASVPGRSPAKRWPFKLFPPGNVLKPFGTFAKALINQVRKRHIHGTAKDIANQQAISTPEVITDPEEDQKATKEPSLDSMTFHADNVAQEKELSRLKTHLSGYKASTVN